MTATDTIAAAPAPLKIRPQGSSLAGRVFPLIGLVLLADQISKAWILAAFRDFEIVEVVPGLFNLTLTYNQGAAFGLFSSVDDAWRGLVLGVTTAAAVIAVLYFLLKDYRSDPVAHVALGLVLGGASGNIVDRLRFGKVVDFLDFYWRTYHWPAFNLADTAICVGVAVLLLRAPRHEETPTAIKG